jgi:glutathionylspermidine synthase
LVNQIGWDIKHGVFVGLENERIETIFKLYPWEMITKEPFWKNVMQSYPAPIWIEPIWKMMFSNKALLAVLWEMYPGHRNLLPAYFDAHGMQEYVKKPRLGREGANVSVWRNGIPILEMDGRYADSGFIYQQLSHATNIDGKTAVIGSWLVADAGACGIGIRESDSLVTGNVSRFTPHVIEAR